MDGFLTQDDLAKRWNVTKRCIENWRKEGVLQPAKGIPAIRFSPSYVTELEGTKLEKFSLLEKKRLEKEIEDLKQENDKLKGIISKVLAATSEAVTY